MLKYLFYGVVISIFNGKWINITKLELSTVHVLTAVCITVSCKDLNAITCEVQEQTEAKLIHKRRLCNCEVYIRLFTPPQHLHSTKWVGTAPYQMIDWQLRDAFRKTALYRWLTPRLLLWKQRDWRYCMCWGGTGGVGGLRILCKIERKHLPQPHRSSCIIYWKKFKGESKTHRSMRI